MIIFMKKMRNGDIENNKVSVVNKKRAESLSDFVRRVRNEKGYSLDKVQQLSLNSINASYVSRIENGQVLQESITAKKLRALAKGLGVSEEEVFAVARGKSLEESEKVDADMALFASRVKKLTPQQKRDFQIAWRMANELLDRLEREKGEQAQGEDRR